jgi:hypothetical protein
MREKIKFLLFFLLIYSNVFAQTKIKCAHKPLSIQEINRKNSRLNKNLSEYFLKNGQYSVFSDELIKVPVVIHIIHNNSSGSIGGPNNGNISNEQVFSQIKVLNEDYRRKAGTAGFNNCAVGVDMNIEFHLAETDPKGNPSSGINRIYNSKPSFNVFDDNFLLSEISYWDSSKYLNIWVTSIEDDYLGFGEFPGGALNGLEPEDVDARVDGIMIDHNAFGKHTGTAKDGVYTSGRTLTHEIGHWFGLLHTWGDEYCGDDYCNDTPPTERANLSVLCETTFSNCSGKKTLNMIENFMDYTPDTCMNIFTIDQKNRIRVVLEISKRRKKFIENTQYSFQIVDKLLVKILENPSSSETIRFQILVKNNSDYSYEIIDTAGRKINKASFKDSPSRIIEINKATLPKGIVILNVKSGKDNFVKRLIIL